MRRVFPAAVAVALLAAGCSSPEGETVYVTEASWVDAEGQPAEQPLGDEPSDTPVAAETAEEAAEAPAAAPAAAALPLDPAHQGQIGGNCGTTPEGAQIRAGDSTSCDFAAAVYPHALGATYSWTNKPGVTSVPFTNLTGVVSPITGEAYDLRCNIGSSGDTLSCSGPNNDPYMSYGFDPGRTWHSLVNIVGDYPS